MVESGYSGIMKRRLIVNADDLGMSVSRTHGIFAAFEQGIVTSTTVLPNGADASRAAKHAREKNIPTGVHLVLTEGEPLSPVASIASLVEDNGAFFDRIALRRKLVAGDIDPVHLERELRAQLEWACDACGAVTHVDSHHHVHVHPVVAPVLAPMLQRYGLRWVRIPEEPLPPYGFEISEDHLARAQVISEQAALARALYTAEGVGSTLAFRGLALVGHASQKNLRHILGRLPDGVTELMVHPGSIASSGTPFDLDPQRQTELQMLTDASLLASLGERSIELTSYRSLE